MRTVTFAKYIIMPSLESVLTNCEVLKCTNLLKSRTRCGEEVHFKLFSIESK